MVKSRNGRRYLTQDEAVRIGKEASVQRAPTAQLALEPPRLPKTFLILKKRVFSSFERVGKYDDMCDE